MKVLGICAGRKNGNTEIMMKEAFMAIEEKCGAECQLVRVQESSIHTCTGCEACMTNHLKGNWEFRCIHKNGTDHFYFIEQLMREADAIIVSSPAYNLLCHIQLPSCFCKIHIFRYLNKISYLSYRHILFHSIQRYFFLH